MCALNADDIAFCPESFVYNLSLSLLKKSDDGILNSPILEYNRLFSVWEWKSSRTLQVFLPQLNCTWRDIPSANLRWSNEPWWLKFGFNSRNLNLVYNIWDFYFRPNCQSAETRTAGRRLSSKDEPWTQKLLFKSSVFVWNIYVNTSRNDAHMLTINILETDCTQRIFWTSSKCKPQNWEEIAFAFAD